MNYTVQQIENKLSHEWLLKKHYAKRLAPIQYCFGLFDAEDILQGVITFGMPAPNPMIKIFTKDFNFIELNRLCINEGLEKNTLSFFVSSALKKLPKPLTVVSYADTSQNHHGYIYQATNWVYTGLSAKRTDWKIKGMEHLHNNTIVDMTRGKENRAAFMREKFGENFSLVERPRKHRYFYFLGNKRQVKSMLNLLPYKIEKYPKGDNIRYDASYKPTTQKRIF